MLSNKRRLEIYYKMKEYMSKNSKIQLIYTPTKGIGLCFLTRAFMTHKEYESIPNNMGMVLFVLPEIMKYKPKRTYDRYYWYRPGETRGRLKIVNKAINDVEKLIQLES